MPELIPLSVLFGNPERESPRISPDGTSLAWIAPSEGVLNVWLAPISAEAGVDWAAAHVITDDTDRGIRQFEWAHDGRHLLYLQDIGGDENWRLHDVDLHTKARRDLTPFDGVQTQIIGLERSRPDEVLLGLNKTNPELHDVYRLDLVSGELTKEIDNPGFIAWVTDTELTVRGAAAPRPDGSFALLVRDGTDAEWRELLAIPAEDAEGLNVVGFSPDGDSLLITSSVGAQTSRLVRIDVATGATEVLAEDPQADVTGVKVDPGSRQPQIVAMLKDRMQYQVLDQSVAADLAAIRALHPGDPTFEGGEHSDRIWLVGFTNDSGPIPYFAYDRQTRQARFLFDHQPALSRYELAPMEPFRYQSRDGLTIHGYATFPPGAQRASLPTVLVVHGGPWGRVVWGFSPGAQWLANRGYLCLEVNYRGSVGYGKAFLNAGDREWGGKMQDDLTDAVAHAIGRGWADPAKVAILGGSYGGYAALAGAAFTPDVYCCAVDICGPSNLITLIQTIPSYWAPVISQFHRRVGDPDEDRDFLWSRSPLSRASEIRIPLLIAQGANDPRVKQAESEQIVAALKQAGIEYDYMLFSDEGHGFAKPENRLKFYTAADKFLARYLGGRSE
jgi:dipeptidyl aminopeptidase/acylaminoacyl peptidase